MNDRFTVFRSSLVHRADDGGGLGAIRNDPGERRDGGTSANRTRDRHRRIRYDDNGLHSRYRFPVFRSDVEAPDKSYGYHRQAVASADLLFLRRIRESAVRADIRRPSRHDLPSRRDLHVGRRFPRPHNSTFIRPAGELQAPATDLDLLQELRLRSE